MKNEYLLISIVILIILISSINIYYNAPKNHDIIINTGNFCTDFSNYFTGCWCIDEELILDKIISLYLEQRFNILIESLETKTLSMY